MNLKSLTRRTAQDVLLVLMFLSCFIVGAWLICFPSGMWTTKVPLFMVSGGIATISWAALIWVGYLGIHFRSEPRDFVQTPENQSLVLQDSGSDTANIEKLQEPSAIVESEESKQEVFGSETKKQTTALKYEESKRNIVVISVERDRQKRIHYRDLDSGKFVKKNQLIDIPWTLKLTRKKEFGLLARV